MQVNFKATRARFKATGRMPGLWAEAKGLNADLFRRWLKERYRPAPGGAAEQRYINSLSEDGLLVLKDDNDSTLHNEA